MRLLVQAGQPGAALRHYQQCEETLRRELGVEPEAETRMLRESIRSRQRIADHGQVAAAGEHHPAPGPVAIRSSRLESRRARTAVAALRAELSQRMVRLSQSYVSLAGMAVVHSRSSLRQLGAEPPPSVDLDGRPMHRTLDLPPLE